MGALNGGGPSRKNRGVQGQRPLAPAAEAINHFIILEVWLLAAEKKKTTSRSSSSSRKKAAAPPAESSGGVPRGVWAAGWGILGLVTALALLPIDGAVLLVMRSVLGGALGIGLYLLPAAMFLVSALLFIRRKGPVRLRAFCIMMEPVLLAALIHAVFWADDFERSSRTVSDLLTAGAQLRSGGLLGGLLFLGLDWALSWIGAVLVLVVVAAGSALAAARITPLMLFEALKPPEYSYDSEEERERYEAPPEIPNVHVVRQQRRQSRGKPNIANYNIPLDDESPAPPVLDDDPAAILRKPQTVAASRRKQPISPAEYLRGTAQINADAPSPDILDLVQQQTDESGTLPPNLAEQMLVEQVRAAAEASAARNAKRTTRDKEDPFAAIVQFPHRNDQSASIEADDAVAFDGGDVAAFPGMSAEASLEVGAPPPEPLTEPPVKQEDKPPKPKTKAEEKREAERAAEEMAAKMAAEMDENQQAPLPPYTKPSLELLNEAGQASNVGVEIELQENSARLVDTLQSFNIDAKIIGIVRGPSVTRFELTISRGVKFSRITALADDIALALGAVSVRIAPIPDKVAIGIEVPNKTVTMVSIRECIGSPAFRNATSKLSFAVGKDITGKPVIGDIAKMPHLLIAGTTGSGKSVCVNSMLISILYNSTPEEVRLIMVDPKMVELGNYNGVPHLLIPVVTDPKKAAGALNWSVGEMERRYKLFADNQVRNLSGFNDLMRQKRKGAQFAEGDSPDNYQTLPQIVIVIDELADLMMVAAKEVETSICRIAQKARAAGMHLIVATQRPSADVITGIMKSNIPSRIAFAVASQVESRIILDQTGAEKLIGKGDMLYAPIGGGKPQRIQGCFISSEEIESVIAQIKESATAEYNEEILEHIERQCDSENDGKGKASSNADGDEDEMLMEAVDVVMDCGQASTSMLQRRLKLGYSRAARIVDQMEERGIVGPFEGSKPRQILITKDEWKEMKLRRQG